MKKRVTALLLSLSMMLCLMPQTALAATDYVQYVQIDSLDELEEAGEYLIVFANSMAALGGITSDNWYAEALEIHPVSGNSGYFRVRDAGSTGLPSWSIQSVGDGSWQLSDGDGNLLTICSQTNLNLTHGTSTTFGNTWRLSTSDEVYLYNLEDELSPNVISENNQTILGDLWSQYYAQLDVYMAANEEVKTAKADVESATEEYDDTLPDYVSAMETLISMQEKGSMDWYEDPDERELILKEDCTAAYQENLERVAALKKAYDYDALVEAYNNAYDCYQNEYYTEIEEKTEAYHQALENLTACLEFICGELASNPDTDYMATDEYYWNNYTTARAATDAAREKVSEANAVLEEKRVAVNEAYTKVAIIGDKLTAQMSGNIYGFTQIMQSGCANLLILRKADSVSLTVTDDRTATNLTAAIPLQWETRPEDVAYINVQSARTGTDAYDTTQSDAVLTIQYASDAATSQIEAIFGLRETELDSRTAAQEENDGRVMTDKSVVYGADDYQAFDTYETGEFSVTLSALGQEFQDGEDTIATPIDVVFLLDLSQSMTNYTDPDKETLEMRWTSSVDAINYSMKQILDAGEENRVGLVCFSNTAVTVLPLGRYTAEEDAYITYEEPSNFYSDDEALIEDMKTLQTADSLKDADGSTAYAGIQLKDFTGLFEQTYTQRGLQEVYSVFQNADTQVEEKFNGTETMVSRQPVIVMVTDGDPTLATYNYMDPSSGPDYGDGFSYGIEGYYTILSANYFKNMISLHYENQALFYSIGLGIKPEGHGNYRSDRTESDSEAHEYAGTDNVDDAYRRAVLDPSEANIEELTNGSGTDRDQETSIQLRQLLLGEDNSSIVQKVKPISNTYLTEGLGYTVMSLRGIENPYSETGYDYVDEAYFGNLSEEEMEQIFSNILGGFAYIDNSVSPLAEGTDLVITDTIDSYMEVKGTPVLRYQGVNHEPIETETLEDGVRYIWEEGVTALIQTDSQTGQTTVSLSIPAEALPTFYMDLYNQFYYEEMPMRLIYQVGLTEKEQQQIQNMACDDTKVYYTNIYDETQSQAGAYAVFTPADENPYYKEETSTLSIAKVDAGITDTCPYVWKEEAVSNGGQIRQELGNNGKLIVTKTQVVPRTPETTDTPDTTDTPGTTDTPSTVDTPSTTDSPTTTTTVTPTGDTQMLFGWLAMTGVAAGVLLLLYRKEKRRKRSFTHD